METESYDPSIIESKWQKKWEEAKTYEVDLAKAKKPYYTHVMFPYPSGDKLHVGHWYNYGGADTFARFKRMCGYDVFSPIGFDAFGLPAENYAVKTGVHPATSITNNVETMIRQLKRIGCMYDWGKSVNTSTPEYYRWTQWLFLTMWKNSLAERRAGNVNFCPTCQTVLANEQVWDGKCERCETEIIQKPLTQWYWKITKYADRLLKGLDSLDWPEKTKMMQRNWIGRSEGVNFRFRVSGMKRGVIGPINWPTNNAMLAGGLNRRLTDEWGRRIHSPIRTVHIVFTPHQRINVFENTSDAERILSILDAVAQRHTIAIHEAVAMPDHVHLLISFHANRHLERDIVKKLKGASARAYLLESDEQHLWGEGTHFEEVTGPDQFLKELLYIQGNPSKANQTSEGRILSTLPVSFEVYDSIPQTFKAQTFAVIAPEHPLVPELVAGTPREKEVMAFVKKIKKKKATKRFNFQEDVEGVNTGRIVENPFGMGDLQIWVASFVVMDYGTGIVSCSAHDERDFIFAKKYNIPLRPVMFPKDPLEAERVRKLEYCYTKTPEGILQYPEEFRGRKWAEVREDIIKFIVQKGYGNHQINYRLRDWSISRQRYWGAPIPIVYDPEGKAHPIPEKHLPWLLPTDVEFRPTGTAPLAQSKELKERVEKIFGKGWTPEVDTMDTFVCSSFYSYMYLMPEHRSLAGGFNRRKDQFIDPIREAKWMPVQMYIGGAEHACMHLIYARFVGMVLRDLGFITHGEQYRRLIHQGVITNHGAKMSKSKNNVVSPDSFVEKYGSDVFRMYLMFMGPFTEGGDWSDSGIRGIDRFVKRVHAFFTCPQTSKPPHPQRAGSPFYLLHRTIKKVTEDIEKLHFNTAISTLMEFLNEVEKTGSVSKETAVTFVKLLAPLAPHLAEELWESLEQKGFVIDAEWPEYDASKIVSDTFTLVVQVNGKMRANVELPTSTSKENAILQAKEHENVKKYLEGKSVKKEIYVEGKLVSFVV